MVRFRLSNDLAWEVGILLEYPPWYKVAEILCKGKIHSVHASMVQLHTRHPDNIIMLRQRSSLNEKQCNG